MNRIHYWIAALLLLCVGCDKSGESSYVITGRVINPVADGNIVYLSYSNGDELINLDSMIVDGGQFSFSGVQEEPIIAYLRFKSTFDSLAVPAVFVLENGALSAHMDTLFSCVTGTPQNNELFPFLQETHRLDSLRKQNFRQYLVQVEAGKMDSLTEQTMYDADYQWEREGVRLAYRFIRKNDDSPAALWMLETMQSRFSEDELHSLVSSLDGTGKTAPIVTEITQRLRNANRIGTGSPYADIALIGYSGRPQKLSGHVGFARYTVIGFWRSDSKPACRDMVKLSQLYRKYGYRGATFLGISLDESSKEWRNQVSELRLYSHHQCRTTRSEEAINLYALASIPSFLIIAPDGTVDSRNLSIEQLAARLQELLPRDVRRDSVEMR